jgi:putative two-component system response regulator
VSSSQSIDALLQSKTSANEPEFKIALTRLSSEIKGRMKIGISSTPPDFFLSALQALSRIKGVAHADVRMSCLIDSGHFLYSNGFDTPALGAIRQLDELARRAKDRRWIRRADTLGGMVEADLGNVAGAVVRYANALSLSKEMGDEVGELVVLCNTGAALNYGGLYHEAIPCLERAVALSLTPSAIDACLKEGRLSAQFELVALTNLAQSYDFLEDPARGFQAISLCLSKSTEPTDAISAISRTIREYTFVGLALQMGELAAARAHAEIALRHSRLGGARAKALAEIAQGLCQVFGGDVPRGLAALERVLEGSGNVTATRMAALFALIRACDHIGQPERALTLLGEAHSRVKAARATGIRALLAIGEPGSSRLHIATEFEDLRAFKLKEAELKMKVAENQVISARFEMLERLALTADLKEEASGQHGYRVGKLASLVAERFGWSVEACRSIEVAARLHDIGKISLPDRVLLASETLVSAERRLVNAHAALGAELLSQSNLPQLRMAEEIARCHHECWDGSGYPSGLVAKRIPIHARIVALADVFDALTHGRPYAEAWPLDRALEEIRQRRGTQFDPDLSDVFLRLVAELVLKHSNLDYYLGNGARTSPFVRAREKIRLILATDAASGQSAAAIGSETRH